MKRILFLLAMILIGVNVSFASNKKEKKKAENMVLYEKAVKAMEDNKFVIKIHTLEGRRSRIRLDELTNYFILDGESTLYQFDSGRRWYGTDIMGGGLHYDYPDMFDGKASDVNMEVDNKGNVTFFVSTVLKGRKKIIVTYKPDMKIILKEGSNKCKVLWKEEGLPQEIYYGTIHPIGETEIRKAI